MIGTPYSEHLHYPNELFVPLSVRIIQRDAIIKKLYDMKPTSLSKYLIINVLIIITPFDEFQPFQ